MGINLLNIFWTNWRSGFDRHYNTGASVPLFSPQHLLRPFLECINTAVERKLLNAKVSSA